MIRKLTFLSCVLSAAVSSSAGLIDFETNGSGDPSGASFPAGEYAAQGVTINDSDPTPGSTFLNDTHPANVGTPITGKYVNVGAFDGVDTFLELTFAPGVTSVGFDWATGAGALFINITLLGPGDVFLDVIADATDSTFINDAGVEVPAGVFDGDAGGLEIRRVVIQDQHGPVERVLILDNLRFQQIPEPASLLLITAGAAGLGRCLGRRGRAA